MVWWCCRTTWSRFRHLVTRSGWRTRRRPVVRRLKRVELLRRVLQWRRQVLEVWLTAHRALPAPLQLICWTRRMPNQPLAKRHHQPTWLAAATGSIEKTRDFLKAQVLGFDFFAELNMGMVCCGRPESIASVVLNIWCLLLDFGSNSYF